MRCTDSNGGSASIRRELGLAVLGAIALVTSGCGAQDGADIASPDAGVRSIVSDGGRRLELIVNDPPAHWGGSSRSQGLVPLGDFGFATTFPAPFDAAAGPEGVGPQVASIVVVDAAAGEATAVELEDADIVGRNLEVMGGVTTESSLYVWIRSCDMHFDDTRDRPICPGRGPLSNRDAFTDSIIAIDRDSLVRTDRIESPEDRLRVLLGAPGGEPRVLVHSSTMVDGPNGPGVETDAQVLQHSRGGWEPVSERVEMGTTGNIPLPCGTTDGSVFWPRGTDPNPLSVVGADEPVELTEIWALSPDGEVATIPVDVGPQHRFTIKCLHDTALLVWSPELGTTDSRIAESSGIDAVQGWNANYSGDSISFDPIAQLVAVAVYTYPNLDLGIDIYSAADVAEGIMGEPIVSFTGVQDGRPALGTSYRPVAAGKRWSVALPIETDSLVITTESVGEGE